MAEAIQRRLKNALSASEPGAALELLAQELKAEGVSQREMYDLFSNSLERHRDDADDRLYEALFDSLDTISSPRLFGTELKQDPWHIPKHWTRHAGDIGPFLTDCILKYGGRTSRAVVRLDCEWWYGSGEDWFHVVMALSYQAALESCLRQMLGEPTISSGFPHWLYRSKDVGLTVYVEMREDPMRIIVQRAGLIQDQRLPLEDPKQ